MKFINLDAAELMLCPAQHRVGGTQIAPQIGKFMENGLVLIFLSLCFP